MTQHTIKTLGVMLDCSRNAVMKPEKVKEFAKMIADMGYNMLQLYTEDTYEIQGEPFFGHMRGRYTQAELKDVDAYCRSVGVELVPCIQVLAHLNQLTQWETYAPLFDCNDILMVGDERVYLLIDKMFQTLENCFSSRRVNIGMDEAHFVGLGRYLDEHGYHNRVDILSMHLKRVKEIADKHGFSIMMWSDMFIRLHNHGAYYGTDITIPQETIRNVPEGVELIFWDYDGKSKEYYEPMFRTHKQFQNPIAFAGGLWTWTGYAPNSQHALETAKAALLSAQSHSIETVFFTLWGDGGNACSYYTVLPILFSVGQMAQGCFDQKVIEQKFEETYGYSFQEFMDLELANITKDEPSHFHNPSKYLLFNDPFIGVYDFTVHNQLCERYQKAYEKISLSINGRSFDYLFKVQEKLLEVLVRKCNLGVRIRDAYQNDNKEAMWEIVEDIPRIKRSLKEFFKAFRTMWMQENKPFGLEVQEIRFGGLLYRMNSCEERLQAYLNGNIKVIEELEEAQLAKFRGFEGEAVVQNDWRTTVSTSVNSI